MVTKNMKDGETFTLFFGLGKKAVVGTKGLEGIL